MKDSENIHINRIGGSTIAEILGYSPWGSPHSVYLKMIGEYQGTPSNSAMDRGVALEPVVATMFGGNHPEFVVENYGLIQHPEYEFLTGSPDRVLIDKETGELAAGLEIKTANIITSNEWGEEDTDQIPYHYLFQCMWYAGLLGVPRWYLAVAFFLSESRRVKQYREYVVEFDQTLFDVMLSRAVEFWNQHVVPRNPPEITVADPASVSYYKRRYPSHSNQMWLVPSEEVEKEAC